MTARVGPCSCAPEFRFRFHPTRHPPSPHHRLPFSLQRSSLTSVRCCFLLFTLPLSSTTLSHFLHHGFFSHREIVDNRWGRSSRDKWYRKWIHFVFSEVIGAGSILFLHFIYSFWNIFVDTFNSIFILKMFESKFQLLWDSKLWCKKMKAISTGWHLIEFLFKKCLKANFNFFEIQNFDARKWKQYQQGDRFHRRK